MAETPTKRAIERQARGHCSNPACRRLTRGASSDGQGEISIGEAAHICAAAEGGPRYDANMTPEQRMSADNGIWLCDVHARAVDAKDSKFTAELLREWKKKTNDDSWRSIIHNIPYGPAIAVGEQSVQTRHRLRPRRRRPAQIRDAAHHRGPPLRLAPALVDRIRQHATARLDAYRHRRGHDFAARFERQATAKTGRFFFAPAEVAAKISRVSRSSVRKLISRVVSDSRCLSFFPDSVYC